MIHSPTEGEQKALDEVQKLRDIIINQFQVEVKPLVFVKHYRDLSCKTFYGTYLTWMCFDQKQNRRMWVLYSPSEPFSERYNSLDESIDGANRHHRRLILGQLTEGGAT